ncbi:PREDICTED: RAS protein activator like-3 [Charadrius vociferus]|uniref:RAS protein activator like-3 n=1 Tax=Charadrius vociferus TaxID=50402 RepID=UPI00052156FB|nr:PREDICTED: RAS protein activator like-3 [Charadrius vociferus]
MVARPGHTSPGAITPTVPWPWPRVHCHTYSGTAYVSSGTATLPVGSTHGTSSIPLAPAPDALVWDVSNFSLVDGHLVLVGRDEEASCRSRNRTGSSISDSANLHAPGGRRDPGEHARAAPARSDAAVCWHVPVRAAETPPAVTVPDGERVPSRSGSRESLLPPPSVAELDLTGDNVIVRPVHGSIVGEKFCFQIITGEGSRSFGCTSLAERDRWIENLRRTVQPNKSFLIDLGVAELDRFDDREALIFRENTLATKAIDEYMKLVGGKYLQDTLGEAVAQLCTSDDSCEVDPSKCAGLDLSDNQNNLRQVCEETFQRIATSCDTFPAELGEIFAAWQEECAARGKTPIGQRLVSASLFLRFLCPAIMSPSLFGLVQEYPSEATARTLTLVAKVIQNLANFTTFGEKEAYMGFMNEFLEHNWSTMRDFLQSVANPESSVHMATYDGYVDLALELATLHLLLCDIFSSLDQATQEELEPLPTILTAIREGTPVPVSVRLSSTTERSPAESFKPGFVPPRDLSKHSPLIKSQSLISIRRVRGREDGPEPEPTPAPVPSPPPSRERRNVQRTQSVPAQNKATRRLRKQSSAEHMADPPAEDNLGSLVPHDAPRLRQQLEEANARAANLGARLTAAEGTRKKDLERLKSSEEKNRELVRVGAQVHPEVRRGTRVGTDTVPSQERRLSALEREQAELRGAIAQALGHPRRTGRRMSAQGWDESGDDAQATSV